MKKPDLAEVPAFYHNYINQVNGENLMDSFKNDSEGFIEFIDTIPGDKVDYRYAPGKWSIKEVLQHIIDAERIFDYRALRFARKDDTPLSGFDENLFAANSKAEHRNWLELVEEFKVVRKSSIFMFASFGEDQLNMTGTSNKNVISVLALGFVVIGHTNHHKNIMVDRYLQ